MRPPICIACRSSGSDGQARLGEWLRFADYEPLPRGVVGHPRGLEWFCDRHLPRARRLTGLSSDEALQRMVEGRSSVLAGWLDGVRGWLRRAARPRDDRR